MRVCVCECVCVCVRVCECVCLWVCECECVCEWVSVWVCESVCVWVCVRVCVCVWVSVFVCVWGLHRWLSRKESACNTGTAGHAGLVPGLGKSPERWHGNPFQYSCLENPMGRGGWWAIAHGVTKSPIWLKQLSTHSHMCICVYIWERGREDWERGIGKGLSASGPLFPCPCRFVHEPHHGLQKLSPERCHHPGEGHFPGKGLLTFHLCVVTHIPGTFKTQLWFYCLLLAPSLWF